MKTKIGAITKIRTGKLDANASSFDGKYPFFTCSKEILKINSYSYDCECVLIAGNGDLNVKYFNGKFDAYQRTYIIEDNSNGLLFMPYLYYFFENYVEELRKQSIGGVIKYIKLENLTEASLELPTITEQKRIVKIIETCSKLLTLKNSIIDELDLLIKARFVEMFGEIDDNPNNYPIVTIDDVCYKVTDGKHGGCQKQEDSGYYYVGAREIFDGEIHYNTASQITYTDFAKDYKRCNIEVGDLVIVNTGATIGKSAIAKSPLTDHTLLQKSVALYKVNKDIVNVLFLQYCYMTHPSLYLVEDAAAQPNLLISTIKNTKIYLPSMELQNQFAEFVKQVDKSKFIQMNSTI